MGTKVSTRKGTGVCAWLEGWDTPSLYQLSMSDDVCSPYVMQPYVKIQIHSSFKLGVKGGVILTWQLLRLYPWEAEGFTLGLLYVFYRCYTHTSARKYKRAQKELSHLTCCELDSWLRAFSSAVSRQRCTQRCSRSAGEKGCCQHPSSREGGTAAAPGIHFRDIEFYSLGVCRLDFYSLGTDSIWGDS